MPGCSKQQAIASAQMPQVLPDPNAPNKNRSYALDLWNGAWMGRGRYSNSILVTSGLLHQFLRSLLRRAIAVNTSVACTNELIDGLVLAARIALLRVFLAHYLRVHHLRCLVGRLRSGQ